MKPLLILVSLFFWFPDCMSRVILVGENSFYKTIQSASSAAQAGDTIMILNGIYASSGRADTIQTGDEKEDQVITMSRWKITDGTVINLKGTDEKWITIMAETPGHVYLEGISLQFSDPAYVRIEGLVFEKTTGNGLNIDDGGTFESPAHHILIENCIWQEMEASGNLDELKMSGVIDFRVRNCRFLNGSRGGSMMDMVGCHNGIIEKCVFLNGGSNAIQAKGGSEEIIIRGNRFINGGERAINIGGSTGIQYFRPAGADYEARKIKIWSNIFRGSGSPFAFVGSVDCEVINNTVINPERWVIRILQENVNERMIPCSNNIFRNNIVVFSSGDRPAVNTGPNTRPETFIFSNNLWFNPSDKLWKGPGTPSPETGQILNLDPLFSDEDYHLKSGSPAIGNGFNVDEPSKDYFLNDFSKKRTIGAVEVSKR